MIATFIGHRKIQNCEILTTRLKETIIRLIDDKQVDTFLFGSRSAFDDLYLKTVTKIKKLRPHIKRYTSEPLIRISIPPMKRICSNSMTPLISPTK